MKMDSMIIFKADTTENLLPICLFRKALGLINLYGQHSNCAIQIGNIIIPVEYWDSENTLMSKYFKILEDIKNG